MQAKPGLNGAPIFQNGNWVGRRAAKISSMRCLAVAVLAAAIPAALGQTIPVEALQAARLKSLTLPNVPAEQIAVFSDTDDIYSDSVLKALPAFAAVGRQVFGEKAPSVRLFLMSDEGR